METDKLLHFHSVARYLNFTKAAQECHIAQTAMSRSISSLEEELGFKLFERNNHNVTLTPAGKVFLNDTIGITNDLFTSIIRAQSVSSQFNEYIAIGYGAYELPLMQSHVEAFRKENPKTEIELFQYYSMDLPNQLVTKGCDITYGPDNRFYDIKNTDVITLGKSRSGLAVSIDSPLAEKEYVTAKDLNGLPFVIPVEKNSLYRELFIKRCETIGFAPSKIVSTNSPEAMLTYVAMHLGYALIPMMIEPYARKDLKFIPLHSENQIYKLHLCACLKNSTNEAAIKYMKFIRKAVDNKTFSIQGFDQSELKEDEARY